MIYSVLIVLMHQIQHVTAQTLACHHPFLCISSSVPWHGEWWSHKFRKMHFGSRKWHEQKTNIDINFRIDVSILRIIVSFLDPCFQSAPWMWSFCSLLNFETVITDYADSVLMKACGTSWGIWMWISTKRKIFYCILIKRTIRKTATTHIFKWNKRDDEERQIQVQFQFPLIFRSQLFSENMASQCGWQQWQLFTRWTVGKRFVVLVKKCCSNPTNNRTIRNCI